MTSRPTITNIHTEEDANGIRVRIEGEGDLLQGHLAVMVRPAEVEGTPDANGDSEGSETSDWGQPDALPVDMGFGHFMLNLQTGVIQWCPSGAMQPDASPDWVVINDPSISEDPMNDAVATGGIDSGREPMSEVCQEQTEAQDMANSQ